MKKIGLVCACITIILFACNKDDCPQGYTGSDCDIQIAPASITLNSVDVTDFPDAKSDGSGWDDSNGPDIYFKLYRNDSEIFTSDTKSDVLVTTDLIFTDGMPFNIANVDDDYTISFFDEDGLLDANDEMGSFVFDMYSSLNSFPDVIHIENPGGSEFDINIHVDYNF
ncbi:MAG: hypothetical protein H7Y00_04990 [Fimbriimonadaceae bacterium]|nr:hypothetical protein [Chitinophagales bacterium]